MYFYLCQGRCKVAVPGEIVECGVKNCEVMYSSYFFICENCPGVPEGPFDLKV